MTQESNRQLQARVDGAPGTENIDDHIVDAGSIRELEGYLRTRLASVLKEEPEGDFAQVVRARHLDFTFLDVTRTRHKLQGHAPEAIQASCQMSVTKQGKETWENLMAVVHPDITPGQRYDEVFRQLVGNILTFPRSALDLVQEHCAPLPERVEIMPGEVFEAVSVGDRLGHEGDTRFAFQDQTIVFRDIVEQTPKSNEDLPKDDDEANGTMSIAIAEANQAAAKLQELCEDAENMRVIIGCSTEYPENLRIITMRADPVGHLLGFLKERLQEEVRGRKLVIMDSAAVHNLLSSGGRQGFRMTLHTEGDTYSFDPDDVTTLVSRILDFPEQCGGEELTVFVLKPGEASESEGDTLWRTPGVEVSVMTSASDLPNETEEE